MKNILLSVLLLASTALAQDKQFYRDFEFQIDTFYATVTPDFEQETGSAGIGANVFFTRNFGLGVSTALENMDGTLVDNVSLRAIYRVPIEERTALYAYGGSTRLLKAEEWTIDLGVGAEHRFFPNAGPFAEIGMVKLMKHSAEATARIGVRFSF